MTSQQNGLGDNDTHTRLHGRWLLLARAVWLVAVALVVSLYVFSIPLQIRSLQTPCTDNCQYGQGTPAQLLEAQHLGMSLDLYVAYNVALNTFFLLVFVGVGALIFWRKSRDWFGIYVALALVLFGISFSSPLALISDQYSSLSLPLHFMAALGGTLIGTFAYMFPDGRFVPRWTRWLVPLVVVREFSNVFSTDFSNSPLGNLTFFAEVATFIFAQVYRYRRVSGSVQRQQTKWFVYGTTVGLLGYLSLILLVMLTFPNGETTSVLVDLIGGTALYLFILLIPLSLMMAILRYRLWDIDILINRTLVYIPLTAILAGIFAASISLSQKLFIAITGEKSDTATVLTTLIVVAVFDPLKSGLQYLVDRRFKEPRDPAKELHAVRDHATALLQVIDMGPSTQHLLDAAVRAFDATGGAVSLVQRGETRVAYASRDWNGDAALRVPLQADGVQIGMLALGARRSGAGYTEQDRQALQETVAPVVRALALTARISGDQS